MIDIEANIFSSVKAAVAPTACKPTYQDTLPGDKLVTVEEIDNAVYERSMSADATENHARLLYEINVYVKGTRKKSEARRLLALADAAMNEEGFVRIWCKPTPNLADGEVYRITARYRAIADRDHNLYRS